MIKPYKDKEGSRKEQVRQMFDNIARTYDFLNHFLSLGTDYYWRKKAINLLQERRPAYILDVACGTGDLTFGTLQLNPKAVIGIDISGKMLEIARQKARKKTDNLSTTLSFQQADSEDLPFDEASFDAVTVAFGVRNFDNLEKGLGEMKRVLKDGGTMLILEFSNSDNIVIKTFYNFYFRAILPLVGRMFSKDKSAYRYLPESVSQFPSGSAFVEILKKQGLSNVKAYPLTFGVATIYFGQK